MTCAMFTWQLGFGLYTFLIHNGILETMYSSYLVTGNVPRKQASLWKMMIPDILQNKQALNNFWIKYEWHLKSSEICVNYLIPGNPS